MCSLIRRVFCGSASQTVAVIFNVFDLDADERLSAKEFKKIEMSLMRHAADKKYTSIVDLFLYTVFAQHDRKHEGSLSFVEWRRFAEEDDLIMRFLDRMTPLVDDFPALRETAEAAVATTAAGSDGAATSAPLVPASPFDVY